jgi:hypothetical protein
LDLAANQALQGSSAEVRAGAEVLVLESEPARVLEAVKASGRVQE